MVVRVQVRVGWIIELKVSGAVIIRLRVESVGGQIGVSGAAFLLVRVWGQWIGGLEVFEFRFDRIRVGEIFDFRVS